MTFEISRFADVEDTRDPLKRMRIIEAAFFFWRRLRPTGRIWIDFPSVSSAVLCEANVTSVCKLLQAERIGVPNTYRRKFSSNPTENLELRRSFPST